MPIDRTVFDASLDDSGSGTDGTILDKNWFEEAILDPIDAALGGGGTPGGSTTQIQFNDAGAFAGDAGLTYNKTTDLLTTGLLTVTNLPRCSVYHNTVQTIGTGAWTDLQFNAEDFDVGSFHDTAVNNGRLTIPAGASGLYLVVAACRFYIHATGVRGITMVKNGTSIGNCLIPTAGTIGSTVLTITQILQLTAADYLTIQAYQNSGGNLDTSATLYNDRNWFSIVKLA